MNAFFDKIKSFKLNYGAFAVIIFAIVLLVWAYSMVEDQPVENEYIIHIEETHDTQFISETEVQDIIHELEEKNDGQPPSLKEIEDQLESIDFVHNAQVSKDLKNRYIIEIEQARPIARIISSTGKSAYLSQGGELLSLSKKYAARVLLVTGAGANNFFKEESKRIETTEKLFGLIRSVSTDKFWSAQITQIDLNEDLEITAYPQVGKERIEFGDVRDYESKLNKLKIYYNEIVPYRGWNNYEYVKLQYKGQIVCK